MSSLYNGSIMDFNMSSTFNPWKLLQNASKIVFAFPPTPVDAYTLPNLFYCLIAVAAKLHHVTVKLTVSI